MVFFDIIASVVLIYMFFKAFKMVVTPLVVAFLGMIYKMLGKNKEFGGVLEKYKTANQIQSTRRRRSRINPGSGLLMLGKSSIDIGGNMYGTRKH